MHVLDLGCGDGTTALPAAQRGANVLLRFQEGDACDLQGLSDGSSDLVISVFGAMFAPRPFDMAREMVRVTRSGGRIVIDIGCWKSGRLRDAAFANRQI